MNLRSFVLGLLVGLICLGQLDAQTVNGNINGTVRDQGGAIIPGAMVTAKNQETGVEHSALSDETGVFNILSIPAGSYEVSVMQPGFQVVRRNITLSVGASVRVDFALNVGAIADTVEVTAESNQVDTTSSTLSGLVADNVIRELPINGRDWIQLATLQSGVLTVRHGPARVFSRQRPWNEDVCFRRSPK